jgi:hypothetical protein
MASPRSIVLKVIAGTAVFALSFWLTLLAMNQFEPASPWEPLRSNAILTFGDASSSARTLSDGVTLRFLGNGYAEIDGTKDLQCFKYECKFSLTVAVSPTQVEQQFIVGQSFMGEPGWHLLLLGERLVLQTDGGMRQLDTAFSPKPGQRYKVDIEHAEHEARIAVDGVVLARHPVVPFADLARNVTIGGRAGPFPLSMSGAVSGVEISKQRWRH